MINLGTVKNRARASGVYDAERVLGEGAQDSTRVVKEFEGFVTSIGNGCCELQVLQSIDLDVRGRGLNGRTGGGRNGDCRSEDNDEWNIEGREHHSLGSRGR